LVVRSFRVPSRSAHPPPDTGTPLPNSAAQFSAARVQLLRHSADRRRRKLMAAQLLGDLLHLARRNSLDIHLCQGRHQRSLTPLVSLKGFRPKSPLAILGYPRTISPPASPRSACNTPSAIPLALPSARSSALRQPPPCLLPASLARSAAPVRAALACNDPQSRG